MRKVLLLTVMVLLVCSIAYADFDVESKIIKNAITMNEDAAFNITITNNFETTETFRIFHLSFPEWDIKTKPIKNPITITLAPGKQGSQIVYVKPLKVQDFGTYLLDLKVENLRNDITQDVPIRVFVGNEGSIIGDYIATVTAKIDIKPKIDPRDPIEVTVKLNNQNQLDIDTMTINIKSKLFSGSQTTSLGPNEEKTVNFVFDIEPNTKAQQDTILLTVTRNDDTITGPISKNYDIISYQELKKESATKRGFLKKTVTLTYTNDANQAYSGNVRIEAPFISRIFATTSPEASLAKTDDRTYYTWKVDLNSGESVSFEITENYRLLAIILVIIILIILLYSLYKSPISLVKSSFNVQKKEGGISELKVQLTVKNKGSLVLENLTIIDIIPNIAEIEKEISLGTLQPSKILKHEEKGTIIKWTIDGLEPNDERVITYKMKSRLPILGDLSLPAATASAIVNNSKKTAHSNRINVSSS